MIKTLRSVFQLAILSLLFLVGCSSSPQEEFVPLDYTTEDVIQNEISSITKLLETESVKALWRASLLQKNSATPSHMKVTASHKEHTLTMKAFLDMKRCKN